MTNPSFSLSGRRALVTGASRGIGEALAAGLANAGADVAVAARELSSLAAAESAISAAGRKSVAIAIDVRDAGAIRAGVEGGAGARRTRHPSQ
jgi:NAD(P)-dependent dehydrogenase (short-subunit alcohol dehydrogenase family)